MSDRGMQTMRSSREARRVLARLVGFAVAASAVLVLVALVATFSLQQEGSVSELRADVVEINETRAKLSEGVNSAANLAEADAALAGAQDSLRSAADARSIVPTAFVWAICAAGVLVIWVACAYLYLSVIRPFLRLELFADAVAQGNLDMPLAYERGNPFGRFTWAFDNMRKEIKRARTAEANAIEQNKTTIAALSHDIKTPIASIRAYSEAFELGLARTEDERLEYARTIARKCDEVTALTNDLFLHALADLERIEVSCTRSPIDASVRQAISDFDAVGGVRLVHLDSAIVNHDPKRLVQVMENLLANAAKYAPGAIVEVSGVCVGGARGFEAQEASGRTSPEDMPDSAYRIEVRDFGPGMLPEDLPFAFDRFYRGGNAGDAPGAGLGLFIVRYLVEQMGGIVRLEDATPGLRVILDFPAVP